MTGAPFQGARPYRRPASVVVVDGIIAERKAAKTAIGAFSDYTNPIGVIARLDRAIQYRPVFT
jgi:hypothetical protein